MKKLINRVNYVLNGEDGASNVEIIVWFSVVFVIATVLFVFKDTVKDFIGDINNRIGGLDITESNPGNVGANTGSGRN